MEDISDLAPLSTSTPETAAQNISHGNLFNIDPRTAAQNKSVYDEKANQILAPQQAEPPVADYSRQSSEHAALAKPDTEHLNFMSRQAKSIGDFVHDRPTTSQQVVDLNLKKMNQDGKLDDYDQTQLDLANAHYQELQDRDYGMSGPLEKIPAWIAGGISDMGQSTVRGFRKGLLENPLGAPASMDQATANIYYGVMVKDPFDTLTAGTYNELSSLTDDQGNPKNLDHETKLNIARGVGAAGVVLMNAGGPLLAETLPWLKPLLNPFLAKGLINTPAKAATLMALGSIVKGAVTFGGVSALTEAAKVIGDEVGLNKGTNEAGLWNSLGTAVHKLGKYGPRVLEAGAQGLATGAALELPIQIAGFGRTKQAFQRGFGNYVENLSPERDVTPEPIKQITGEAPKNPDSVVDITPSEPPGGHDPVDQARKALQMNEALHQMNDVQKATNMEKVAPTELTEVTRRALLAAGIKNLYASYGTLLESSDAKNKAARDLIDPSGTAAGQINAPVAIEAHKVMEVAKEYPGILDHVSHEPDGMTGMQAKEFAEAHQRAEEKRFELMQSLGIKSADVQPEQGNVGGKSVAELPVKAPQAKPDFEAYAQATGELLSEKKATEQYITEKTAMLEQLKNAEVPNIADKETIRKLELGLKNAPKQIEDIDKALESLKAKVTEHLKENPPGSLLMFPFDEKKAATNAEMKFGREPTFSEALRTVLPEKQVQGFDEAVLRARQHVTNMVHDQAVHEMNKVVDQTEAIAKDETTRREIDRIAHDPNYALVDKFLTHQIANAKGKAKQSIYAIDPKSLPDNMLHFLDNPRLKDHKVFVKGANSLEDSAHALGFGNGLDLLETLAKTPTRQQMIKARVKFNSSDIEQLARESVDLDHTSIVKAFTDKTKAYLETMRFLKDTDWSKTKFGIKTIALPLPKIEEVMKDARDAVLKMTTGSLKPSQFAMGEKRSYRNAVDKFLAGDLAGAFHEKEMAARNAAMQMEVKKAIAVRNRVQKFARRLEDPTAQNIIAKAGGLVEKAINEILDVYNLNPKKKDQAEKDSYAKWVKREVTRGRGDFSIPDRLADVRKSMDDMTVEQVLVAEDRLRAMFKEAQYKSELIDNENSRQEERSIERIVNEASKRADTHRGQHHANFKDVQGNDSPFAVLRHLMQDAQVAFTNMEHVLRYYDQGEFNGFFQKTFMRQIKGDGEWNGKMGVSKELNMSKDFAKKVREIMKNHGSYDKVERTKLNIPEFKDHASLSHGNLTKGDLMTLWAYKGDPDGRAKLQSNFRDSKGKGIMIETWQKVFDRELTEADVTSMQYAVDMYENYKDETRDLQLRTKGEQVVFVKPVPNKWNGKFFPGGYVPNKHLHDWTAKSAKLAVQALEGKRAAWFEKNDGADFGRQFAAEQTEQGRLIQREGSSKPLDASLIRFWRGHEEVIHDLSYREPTMNALNLLRDRGMREAMIKMGGEARYNLLVNSVIEVAGRAQMMNANYFSDQNRFFKGMSGYAQSRFNVVALGLNASSALIQYEELTQLLQNIGWKGQRHFAMVNAKMMATPHLWGGYLRWAGELDPTIGSFLANVQNKITSTVHDLIPTKHSTPVGGPLKLAGKKGAQAMFAAMSVADVHDKVICAMTCYSQFMSGDANNWPIEKVMALSDKERDQQAQAYVRQMSRLSLMHGRPEDKAPSQKHPLMEYFSTYWNFFRNVLNNQVNHANRAKWAIQGVTQRMGEGGGGHGGPPEGPPPGFDEQQGRKDRKTTFSREDSNEALKYFGTAAGIVALTAITASLGRFYTSKIRGEEDTPDKWNIDWKSKAGIADGARRYAHYMMMSPLEQLGNAQPIVRNVLYAANSPDRTIRGFIDRHKQVDIPITKQLSDAATAINLIREGAQQTDSLIDFLTYLTNLNNTETKTLMSAEADFFIPFPVNAYSKLMKYLEKPLNAPAQPVIGALQRLDEVIKKYNEKQGLVAQGGEPGHFEASQKFNNEVKDIQKQIQPEIVKIPDDATDKIKTAMSGGDWSKPNGIYGFTPEDWSGIKKSAPELGLTDSGRIAKDTTQQEKAADWLNHKNAEMLSQMDIKVNNETLYGAFRLGVAEYQKLWTAPANEKVKSVLSEETLKQNPDLADAKTVGQLKEKLANQLTKKTAELTPPTKTAEDDL